MDLFESSQIFQAQQGKGLPPLIEKEINKVFASFQAQLALLDMQNAVAEGIKEGVEGQGKQFGQTFKGKPDEFTHRLMTEFNQVVKKVKSRNNTLNSLIDPHCKTAGKNEILNLLYEYGKDYGFSRFAADLCNQVARRGWIPAIQFMKSPDPTTYLKSLNLIGQNSASEIQQTGHAPLDDRRNLSLEVARLPPKVSEHIVGCWICGGRNSSVLDPAQYFCKKCKVGFCHHCAAEFVGEKRSILGNSMWWECPNCGERQDAEPALYKLKKSEHYERTAKLKSLSEHEQKQLDDYILRIKEICYFKPDGKPEENWRVFPGKTVGDAQQAAIRATGYIEILDQAFNYLKRPEDDLQCQAGKVACIALAHLYSKSVLDEIHARIYRSVEAATHIPIYAYGQPVTTTEISDDKVEIFDKEMWTAHPTMPPSLFYKTEYVPTAHYVTEYTGATPVSLGYSIQENAILDAQRMALVLIANNYSYSLEQEKLTKQAAAIMNVWQKGYGFAAEIDGMFYVYCLDEIPG